MTSSVARQIARDRRPEPASPGAASRYVNLWREPEALGGERVTAFVAILRTRGCYWADVKGCSMCGYAKDTLGRSAVVGDESGDRRHRYDSSTSTSIRSPSFKVNVSRRRSGAMSSTTSR